VHICGFFLVLVWPCQLFVRLCYRVSNVLDLSLVSKRFGFGPHITHVRVLTFKEIKHLSDCQIIGLSNCRSIGLSDHRTVRLSDYRSNPVNKCSRWSWLMCKHSHHSFSCKYYILITCLLVGECTYHKFDNTQDH
jgi:hypothetical protein